MANPLHKNKVIQFIKRYPNSSTFELTQGNALTSRPGDPPPNTQFIPGCSVGLSSQAGNPSNFNSLIDMWVSGGLVRNNINPFGLMRLWAAAYRTYFGFIRQVKRPYFNFASGTTTSIKSITPDDYSVTFTSSSGTASISNRELTGAFTTGIPSFRNGEQLEEIVFGLNDLTGVDVFDYFPDIRNEIDLATNRLSAPYGAIARMSGGPITCQLDFKTNVDITNVKIPVPTTPLVANWFDYNNFTLRASYDGTNFTSTHRYDQPQFFGDPVTISYFRKYFSGTPTQAQFDNPNVYYQLFSTSINALNRGTLFRGIIPTNSIANVDNIQSAGSYFTQDCIVDSFIPSSNSNTPGNAAYQVDFSPITKGLQIPNGELLLTLTRNGVPFPARIRVTHGGVSASNSRPIYNFTAFNPTGNVITPNAGGRHFVPPAYNNNALFKVTGNPFPGKLIGELLDITNPASPVNLGGSLFCEKLSFNQITNLEIRSNFNQANNPTTYLVSYVVVNGTTRKTITNLSSNTTGPYVPNFSDSYWTNNSPEDFLIGGVSFSDEIAKDVYQSIPNTYTNVDKWKLMPYTLPFSSILLESKIKLSSSTVRDVPLDFNYTEDYLTNKLISLPAISDLPSIEQAAAIRGISPIQHYYELAISNFLVELIDYCKSTCLKFWKWEGRNLNVRNYQNYTNSILNVDSLTTFVPLDSRGRPVSAGIGTYGINSSGAFSIETNTGAGQLWFLSGGGASRVDVDIAVLQQLVDISGITL